MRARAGAPRFAQHAAAVDGAVDQRIVLGEEGYVGDHVAARVAAEEKMAWAGEKFRELQEKDPKEFVEDAKEFARQKPGQTILISAAIGLVVGLLLRRK